MLDVEACEEVKLDDLFAECGALRKLHSLLVMADDSPYFTDVSLFYIGQLTTLRRLHLVHAMAQTSDHGLHALVHLSKLEVLEVPCWRGQRPPGFMKALQALQVLPKLKELDISIIYRDDHEEVVDYGEFVMNMQNHDSDEHTTVDDVEFVKCISGFTGLRHLTLYGCPVAFTQGGRELLKTLGKDGLQLDYGFRVFKSIHRQYQPYYRGHKYFGYEEDSGSGTRPVCLETGKGKDLSLCLRLRNQERKRRGREKRVKEQAKFDAERPAREARLERLAQRRPARLLEEARYQEAQREIQKNAMSRRRLETTTTTTTTITTTTTTTAPTVV